MKRTKKGFTLVELVIVIAVIAILAAVLIPTFSNVLKDSRKSAAELEVRNAIEAYLTTMVNGEPQTLSNEEGYIIDYTNSKNEHYYFYYVEGATTSFELGNAIGSMTASVTIDGSAKNLDKEEDEDPDTVEQEILNIGNVDVRVYVVQS